jgi:hypothetical protein
MQIYCEDLVLFHLPLSVFFFLAAKKKRVIFTVTPAVYLAKGNRNNHHTLPNQTRSDILVTEISLG